MIKLFSVKASHECSYTFITTAWKCRLGATYWLLVSLVVTAGKTKEGCRSCCQWKSRETNSWRASTPERFVNIVSEEPRSLNTSSAFLLLLICHAAAFPIHIQYLLFLLQIFQSWTSLKEFPLVSQMAMIKSWTLKLFWNLTKACISKQSSYAQKNITVCLVVDAVQHIQLILTF